MSGYDQFFKKAKDSKGTEKPAATVNAKPSPANSANKKSSSPRAQAARAAAGEDALRAAFKVPPKRGRREKNGFPIVPTLVVMIGFGCAGWGYFYPDMADKALSSIEISLFSTGLAAENETNGAGAAANSAETKAGATATSAEGAAGARGAECVTQKGFSEEELSHFNKLNERKGELDRREAELNLLEEELHKQKSEVEARVLKLEQIREDVAGVLKDRVEIDQQRVATLVDFYSNMKPKQAADIFATLNEDLSVEVLTRMKKKNAADILNLLEPAKARALSEKFTGYKRR